MAITITCADGANDFTCCAGTTTNDHDFKGVIVDDGTHEQRLINPIQLARKASSVLVFDENGSYVDIAVADVAAASNVNELVALLIACRDSSALQDYYTDTSSSTLTWTKNGGNLHSVVFVYQNGNKLVETTHYTITNNASADDEIIIESDTHFTNANYEVVTIKI